ncbi:MAG: methylated-DNA--[protein]-cysteine S-methyltransferase [Planctomycetaceae bacterium]|nr:methylated-DNA--[protein]-cysteine S-methyltransferase [Planctomycetaceae bacterium]
MKKSTIFRIFQETPLGRIGITEQNERITHLLLPGETSCEDSAVIFEERITPLLTAALEQFMEYLAGKRLEFRLPLAPVGTPFLQTVWAELLKIPYGKTASYKDIAERVNHPKAARAVGMANHRNPIPIFIPCHRVIGSSGKLVGFRTGIPLKKTLLELEQQYSR